MGIVAKYKFDGSVYADLIPEFNAEFTNYNITDEVDSENSNHIIRTIESDSLPTLMRFGCDDSNTKTSREESLLEVLDLNTSNLNTMLRMFMHCSNLKSLSPFSDIGTTTSLMYMCYGCESLEILNLENVKFNNSIVLHQACMNCFSLINLKLPIENFYVFDVLSMLSNCSSLKFLNLSNLILSSSGVNFSSFINNCWELTTLDISNLNTNQGVITGDCGKLKYVKCNIPLTIQTISSQLPTRTSDNPGVIIYQGTETLPQDTITALNSKGWNVATNPTLIAKYKYDSKIYKNLIPVFNEGYMGFIEDEEVDESGVVTRIIEHVELPTLIRFFNGSSINNPIDYRMRSLISLDFLDISNLTSLKLLLGGAINLKYVNCKDWNTSNITSMSHTFCRCYSLKSLDLSGWDTRNVETIEYMLYETGAMLDISNFNLCEIKAMNYGFEFNSSKDIGMIYCDQSTINKVASALDNTTHRTIWVESDDILQYDQYDHITYKTQKVQDTVHLNSPLLKGDTIEVIDGKTYHVHRWAKVVLVSPAISSNNLTEKGYKRYYVEVNGMKNTECFCDRLPYNKDIEEIGIRVGGAGNIGFTHFITDLDELKQWLQENPTTVVYQLATPYYELISEEPLELTLLDTTDNTINNNSILPSNMSIANKELSTIAIKPSTIYTLSFDKSNEDSEVTIDICGGEQITTVLNRVELTTPSGLGSGIRFISSDGCIISNVRLLEGSLVESAIPKETFEGLKNSFEEGYLIGENLIDVSNLPFIIKSNGSTGTVATIRKIYVNTSYTFLPSTTYTFIIDVDTKNNECIIVGTDNGSGYGVNKLITDSSIFSLTTNNVVGNLWLYYDGYVTGEATINNIIVLEGDYTHLSEAELMRYIEKGTSHYEEEDFNHVGKYKVEYKVTGKNKFNLASKFKHIANNYNMITYVSPSSILLSGIGYVTMVTSVGLSSLLKEGVTYTMSLSGFDNLHCGIGYDNVHSTSKITTFTYDGKQNIFIWFQGVQDTTYNTTITFQLEEGTVATEYEPYKEYTKTYYLSSPLLEGDTIEDINGVATHVKRYGKVVLDGSENWKYFSTNTNNQFYCTLTYANTVVNTDTINCISDKLPSCKVSDRYNDIVPSVACSNNNFSFISKIDVHTTTDTFKQWIQANPTTVVYQLASPIYEPISTESILCDSYVNGHLDLSNENIPIQKTEFRNFTKELAYLQPSTDYVVRFSSDNIGITKVYLDSSVKEINIVQGINEVIITTPSTIVNNNIIIDGIGFNVSDVQVVANVIKNGDIKDFDYFKGLQSSFESELVTDENDENYGKYKVECKIVGKNKFNINSDFTIIRGKLPDSMTWEVSGNNLTVMNSYYDRNFDIYGILVSVNPYTDYYLTYINNSAENLDTSHRPAFHFYNQDGVELRGWNQIHGGCKINSLNNKLIYVRINSNGWNNLIKLSNIQIEEGIQATPYEPYKESIHTLYLNSPLLKGDKLVVHEGKLCHYHKMGMVVLDGSEDWKVSADKQSLTNTIHFQLQNTQLTPIMKINSLLINNQFINRRIWEVDHEGTFCAINGNFGISILRSKLSTLDTDGFKQWLSKNPTTVVYELAEPYYEPIEPQLSQYSFSTVKDGDMEIITTLPIEIDLTYRTDINGVSSIEEQIASIQESTDISSIIDEEVDE